MVNWSEALHPRGFGGKFVSKGGRLASRHPVATGALMGAALGGGISSGVTGVADTHRFVKNTAIVHGARKAGMYLPEHPLYTPSMARGMAGKVFASGARRGATAGFVTAAGFGAYEGARKAQHDRALKKALGNSGLAQHKAFLNNPANRAARRKAAIKGAATRGAVGAGLGAVLTGGPYGAALGGARGAALGAARGHAAARNKQTAAFLRERKRKARLR